MELLIATEGLTELPTARGRSPGTILVTAHLSLAITAEAKVSLLGFVSFPWPISLSSLLAHGVHPPPQNRLPPHLGYWWPCQLLSGRRPGRPQQPARWSWGDTQWGVR